MPKRVLNWLRSKIGIIDENNIYRGKILYMPKKFNMRTWHGKIFYTLYGTEYVPLPKYFQGKRVKLWVRLNDDELGPHGAIFYKRVRRLTGQKP